MTKIIPTGTRMYLTKKIPYPLNIRPDTSLLNDNLFVAYDVRINGQTVIPRGIRVLGDWVTESSPSLAAQFQSKKIFLCGSGQDISADSDVFEGISSYNNVEVDDAGNFDKQLMYKAPSNIVRRIIRVFCRVKTLLDDNLNTIYLEIPTNEIPVTFTADFCPEVCLTNARCIF